MRKSLDPTEFSALFEGVKRSAWRWECQGDYSTDHQKVENWLSGRVARGEYSDWFRYIQEITSEGILFERVRMVTEPLTDYLVWMLAVTNRNVDAGEDIRWCKESSVKELGMPSYDFYIFDDNRVVILRHDEEKNFTHAEIIDDEDFVAEHRALRDKVWPYGVRHREFLFNAIKAGVDSLS